MKISVVTATRNAAATLAHTLRSVREQSAGAGLAEGALPEVEHLVVDGASSDDTLAIVAAEAPWARVWSEPDGGLYEAMNKGIARSTGEVLGFLNADDVYAHPQVLADVARALADPEVDAVYADLVYVHPVSPGRVVRTWRAGPYRPGAFRWGWMPPHPTFFARRSLYERHGGFDTSFGTSADYELMLRLVHRHGARLAYLPQVMVHMRAGGASNRNLRARLDANRHDRQACARHGLHPVWFTGGLKPLRKVWQFLAPPPPLPASASGPSTAAK